MKGKNAREFFSVQRYLLGYLCVYVYMYVSVRSFCQVNVLIKLQNFFKVGIEHFEEIRKAFGNTKTIVDSRMLEIKPLIDFGQPLFEGNIFSEILFPICLVVLLVYYSKSSKIVLVFLKNSLLRLPVMLPAMYTV